MAIDNQKNGNAPIKGLKGINRFSNGATQQDIDNMRARLQAGAKQKLGHTQFTPSNSVTVPMASQVRGFGDSTYDTVMWNMNERDIQNQRADEQSWITQIANGTGKSLVLAGTTFVSGTVGTAFGIVNYLGRGIGEGDWNGKNFWDNPINKWMYNISKESEKWMPNYQDTEAQSRPWYKNVFTNNFGNFLGDSVIKNLGFSIGAYYSGSVWAQALGAISKAAKMGAMADYATKALGGATLSGVGEGSIEAQHGADEFIKQNRAVLDKDLAEKFRYFESDEFQVNEKLKLQEEYDAQVEAINKKYDAMPNKFEMTAEGQMVNPTEQARMEELQALATDYEGKAATITDRAKKEAKANYDNTLVQLENESRKLGNSILVENIVLLTYTNYIMFGRAWAGGMKPTKKAIDGIERSSRSAAAKAAGTTEEAATAVAEGATKGSKGFADWVYKGNPEKAPGKYKAAYQKYGKNFIHEAFEEWNQAGIAYWNKDYYGTNVRNHYAKLNNKYETEEATNYVNSFFQGFNKNFHDANSWLEFFVGGLTGAVGIPVLRKKKGGGLEFALEGGTGAAIAEFNEKEQARTERNEAQQRIVDGLNAWVQKPENAVRYENMSRHEVLQDIMNKAAQVKDEKEFKDAEFAQLFYDIDMFQKAGRINDFYEILNMELPQTQDEFNNLVESTSRVLKSAEQKKNELLAAKQATETAMNEWQREIQQSPNPDSTAAKNQPKIEAAIQKLVEIDEALNDPQTHEDDIDGTFIDANGKSMALTEDGRKAITERIQHNIDKMRGVAEQYIKEREAVDANPAFNKYLNDDQKTFLAYMRAQAENWDQRAKDMSGVLTTVFQEYVDRMIEQHPELGEQADILAGDISQINELNMNEVEDNMVIVLRDMIAKEKGNPGYLARLIGNPENTAMRDHLIGMVLTGNIAANYTLDRASVARMLMDTSRIHESITTYNETFEKYLMDVSNLIKDAKEAETQNDKVEEVKERTQKVKEEAAKTTEELVGEYMDGEMDMEGFDLFDPNMTAEALRAERDGQQLSSEQQAAVNRHKAKEIVQETQRADESLKEQLANGEITQEEYEDGVEMLKQAAKSATTVDDVLDLDSEVYNDPEALARETTLIEDDSMTEEEMASIMEEQRQGRLDKVKNAIQKAKEAKAKREQVAQNVPTANRDMTVTEIDENATTETTQTTQEVESRRDPVEQPRPTNEVKVVEENKSLQEVFDSKITLASARQLLDKHFSIEDTQEGKTTVDLPTYRQFLDILQQVVTLVKQGNKAAAVNQILADSIDGFMELRMANPEFNKVYNAFLREASAALTEFEDNTELQEKEAKKETEAKPTVETKPVAEQKAEKKEEEAKKEALTSEATLEGIKDATLTKLDEAVKALDWSKDSENLMWSKVKEVVSDIQQMFKDGLNIEGVESELHRNAEYRFLIDNYPQFKPIIDAFVTEYGKAYVAKKEAESAQREVEGGEMKTDLEALEVVPVEPEVVKEQIDKEVEAKNPTYQSEASVAEDETSGFVERLPNGQLAYWKPTTTQAAIHSTRGPLKAYWQTLPDANRRKPYLKMIWEFLQSMNVFETVNTPGAVKVGDEVFFAVSKKLTKQITDAQNAEATANQFAGFPSVIPLLVKKGADGKLIVIGDMQQIAPDDTVMKAFQEWALQKYEQADKTGENDLVLLEGMQTRVSKKMVGRPAYAEDSVSNTLNDIHQGEAFSLGIAASDNSGGAFTHIFTDPNRRRDQARSQTEMSIIAPLNVTPGQPFLLMPTAAGPTRAYFPVPFNTPHFASINESAKIMQAFRSVMEKAMGIENNIKAINEIKDRVKELFYIPGFQLSFSKDGQYLIMKAAQAQAIIKLDNTLEAKVNKAIELFKQVNPMIQISKNHINSKYNLNGTMVDYNQMIGEVAFTNLPVGATHTVNEWFTMDRIVEGKVVRAKSPKSLKENEGSREGTFSKELPGVGHVFINSEGKIFLQGLDKTQPALDITKSEDAYHRNLCAWLLAHKNSTDSEIIVQTEYGWFNKALAKIVEEPSAVERVDTTEALPSVNDDLSQVTTLDNPVAELEQQQLEENGITAESLDQAAKELAEMAQEGTEEMDLDTAAQEIDQKKNEGQEEIGNLEIENTGEESFELPGAEDLAAAKKQAESKKAPAKKEPTARELAEQSIEAMYDSATELGKIEVAEAKALIFQDILPASVALKHKGILNRGAIARVKINGRGYNAIILDNYSGRTASTSFFYDKEIYHPQYLIEIDGKSYYIDESGYLFEAGKRKKLGKIGGMVYAGELTNRSRELENLWDMEIIMQDLIRLSSRVQDSIANVYGLNAVDGRTSIDSILDIINEAFEDVMIDSQAFEGDWQQLTHPDKGKMGDFYQKSLDYVIQKVFTDVLSRVTKEELSQADNELLATDTSDYFQETMLAKGYQVFEATSKFGAISQALNKVVEDLYQAEKSVRATEKAIDKKPTDVKAQQEIVKKEAENNPVAPISIETQEVPAASAPTGQTLREKIDEIRKEKPATQQWIGIGWQSESHGFTTTPGLKGYSDMSMALDVAEGSRLQMPGMDYTVAKNVGWATFLTNNENGSVKEVMVINTQEGVLTVAFGENLSDDRRGALVDLLRDWKERNAILGDEYAQEFIADALIESQIMDELAAQNEALKTQEEKEMEKEDKKENDEKTKAHLIRDMKTDGILTPTRQMIIPKVSLENLTAISNLSKLKKKQFFAKFDALVNNRMTEDEVNLQVRKLLGLQRKMTNEALEKRNPFIDVQAEAAKIRKALPQLTENEALRIVESIGDLIFNEANGDKVWGLFKNGIIYVAEGTARGTVYHEAFHYVSQMLLSESEIATLYSEAKVKFGDLSLLELEENLAESFRKYMQKWEDLSFTSKVFETLKRFVKKLAGKTTYLEDLYHNIRTGKLANREVRNSTFKTSQIDKSKVEVEEVDKTWREDSTKSNKSLRIYLKDQKEKGYFELVKDNEAGYYSVHMKTNNGKYGDPAIAPSTKEERAILKEQLLNALPAGAKISTWGSLSKGGVEALNRLGEGMKKVGERQATLKEDGSSITIPIFQKQSSKFNNAVKQYVAVEEALPIQEQKMQEIRDKMKQVTRETSQEWTSKVVSNPALYHGDGFHMIKQSEFATREEALKAMESMGATTKEFFYPTLSNGKYYLISDQNQMLTAAAKRRAALIDEYNAAKKDMDILADYQQTADLWRQYKEVSRKQELEREIQNRPDLEAERKKKLVQEGLEMLENYRHCK